MQIALNKKQLIEIFIFLLILSVIIINWNNVSWIFNYKELNGLISDFFNPYPDTANALIAMNDSTIDIVKIHAKLAYVNQDNLLEIPSIDISAPIIVAKTTNKTALAEDLNKGVVYYPGSVLPEENGQIVILGHSAPLNWPRIKYDYIFSEIDKLNVGDQIILTFNNIKYTYKVRDKEIIQKGQDVETSDISSNILTLISCWPPGKDYQRIAVTAELIDT